MAVLAIGVDLPASAVAGIDVLNASDLCLRSEAEWQDVLARTVPHVIVSSVPIALQRRDEWLATVGGQVLVAVSMGAGVNDHWPVDTGNLVHVRVSNDDEIEPALREALKIVGAHGVRLHHGARAATRPAKSASLVGAGIVNLLTALKLSDHGVEIRLFDRAPDPRQDRPWQEYGCTRGGANARMFTATEADQYGGLAVPGQGGTVFDVPPTELGWDVRRENVRSVQDQAWIREYENLPGWLADTYERDIHDLNRRAELEWERVFEAHPTLGESVNLRRGVVRVYSTPDSLRRAVHRHRRIGDLLQTYNAQQLHTSAPALSLAHEGRLAGGVMVGGFTLDIHRFVAKSLDILEARGAELHFSTEVGGLHADESGVVDGLRVGADVVTASNLVISPGAYGHELLAQLGLGGQIAGVLGLWHTLPNLHAQQRSMKVSRAGTIAADANITVGDVGGVPSLVVGSGYGFVGTSVDNIDRERVRVIQRSVDEMMRTLLPDAYEAAGGAEWLDHDPVFCVRPWTPTSLGLFDVRKTATGQCIVTGGHNTGGFTQAPEVANAVMASLLGITHPMHRIYSIERSSVTYGEHLVKA